MTISPRFFVGTIDPPSHKTCRLVALVPEKPYQILEVKEYDWEETQGIIRHFRQIYDGNDPDFWKHRTIFYMIVCPYIISMAFWPKSSTIPQVIRVENQYEHVTLNEQNLICSGFDYVHNRQSIDNSLATIANTSLKASLKNILWCFLQDDLTHYLVITLLNNSNTPFSWGWKKQ